MHPRDIASFENQHLPWMIENFTINGYAVDKLRTITQVAIGMIEKPVHFRDCEYQYSNNSPQK